MATITPFNNGALGLIVRGKINALIADYLPFNGTPGTGKLIQGNFELNTSQPTHWYTDDGITKNGILWYGSAGNSFLSLKNSDSSYAAFIVDSGDTATMQVQNYTSGHNASIELKEDKLMAFSSAAGFSFDGSADYSPNYTPFSFVQESYVIPINGTRANNPLTDWILFNKIDGSAITSLSSFYIGSGDDPNLDNSVMGSRIYFEAPVLGRYSRINMGGSSSAWDVRNGSARNSLTMNTNTSFNWFQLQSSNGTRASSLVVNAAGSIDVITDDPIFSGFLGGGDYSPYYQPFSWVQKIFTEATYEKLASKGLANGYAPLDGTSKIPGMYLPSYVDDVLEYANFSALPVTGETGKIYITLSNNNQYRWTGSVYVQITNSSAVWGNISGTIAAQADLAATFQPLDPDLTAIAALTGSSGLLKTNGAGSWSIDQTKHPVIFHKDNTDTAGIASTTETIVRTIFIPGGTIVTDDQLRFLVMSSKSGVNGSTNIRIYSNTVNDLSGTPVRIALLTPAANNVYHSIVRNYFVKNASTQTAGYNNTSGIVNDEATLATSARMLFNIDWTAGQYIHYTIQNASALDTTTINFTSITKS